VRTHKLMIPAAIGVVLGLAACGAGSHTGAAAGPRSSSRSAAAPVATAASAQKRVTIDVVKRSGRTYLTGAGGKALYLWAADKKNRSTCSGSCAQNWPPMTASTLPRAGRGVHASDLKLIMRSHNVKQVAYDGHPLYYYVGDTSSGMTSGQGSDAFGAKWWLVSQSGRAVMSGGSGGGTTYGSGY
jgi:predicted lipoprotein with Yx(FWY)xxD motif